MTRITDKQWDILRSTYGGDIQKNIPLSKYTSARIGGPADALIAVDSKDRLVEVVNTLWDSDIPFYILGRGSNILISDRGICEVVILNRTNKMEINTQNLYVKADSGASFRQLARKASNKGLGGLEWATGIPGSVGGAVYGNAGAHGGDIASCLEMAEILHRGKGIRNWMVEQMNYSYRSSRLKQEQNKVVILSARFRVNKSTRDSTTKLIKEFAKKRKNTQPAGASIGSMFRNPPGDYAGRLIEAAGLKGAQIGGASISSKHANFFITSANTSAKDVFALIEKAKTEVLNRFGVQLELEIELLGDWNIYFD
jgi:UDP-N-acetylmuramate dehydrogenase